MMKNMLLFILITSVFACRPNQDKTFQSFYLDYQKQIKAEPMLRAFLEERLSQDSVLIQYHANDTDRILPLAKRQLNTLHQIELERLDSSLHEKYNDAHGFFTIIIRKIETDKVHQTNPLFYSPLSYLKSLSSTNEKEEMINALETIFTNYQLGIANLLPSDTSQLKHAVKDGIQTFEYLSNEIHSKGKNLELEKEDQVLFSRKLAKARLGTKDFIGFCNSKLFEIQDQ